MAVQITHIGRSQANARLKWQAVPLAAKVLVGYVPDGDGWEQIWEESEDFVKSPVQMKLGKARKQRAAKIAVPINSIKVIKPLAARPADLVLRTIAEEAAAAKAATKATPKTVVKVEVKSIEPDSERQKIEALEARIRALLGLLNK